MAAAITESIRSVVATLLFTNSRQVCIVAAYQKNLLHFSFYP
jgi:hypothetical protein